MSSSLHFILIYYCKKKFNSKLKRSSGYLIWIITMYSVH